MGYVKNHLATLVMGVFAAVMTFLWSYFNDFAPVLDFVFLMAVPISWFLVVVLWLSQVSTNYMHKYSPGVSHHTSGQSEAAAQASPDETPVLVLEARSQLSEELDDLKRTVELKDEQIEDLKQQISGLQTRVQIESLRAEIAKLREMASKLDN